MLHLAHAHYNPEHVEAGSVDGLQALHVRTKLHLGKVLQSFGRWPAIDWKYDRGPGPNPLVKLSLDNAGGTDGDATSRNIQKFH